VGEEYLGAPLIYHRYGRRSGTYKAIPKEGAGSFFLQLAGYIVHVPGAAQVRRVVTFTLDKTGRNEKMPNEMNEIM
jgi:hypothetical protein